MNFIISFISGLLCLAMSAGAFASELRIALSAAPETLNPHFVSSVRSQRIALDLFEGLVRHAPDGSIVPGMAETWNESPNHLVWTFKIRRDAKWSDGSNVTADDFVNGFKKAFLTKDYAIPIIGIGDLQNGKSDAKIGLNAIDRHTFQLTLFRPQYGILERLARESLIPVPTIAIERFGNDWAEPNNIISNGAYQLDTVTQDGKVILKRSANYWEAPNVKIDSVIYSVAEASSERLRQFRLGQVDIVSFNQPKEISQSRKQFPNRLFISPSPQHVFLQLNPQKLDWAKDRAIRRALSLAIDRESLANKVLDNMATASDVILPKGLAPYVSPPPPEWPESIELRQAEAKKLWAQTGSPRPTLITIEAANNSQFKDSIFSIAENWKNVLGVSTKLEIMDINSRVKAAQEKNYKFEITLMNSSFVDYFLMRLGRDKDLVGAYTSPQYRRLLERELSAVSTEERMKALSELERQLMSDAFMIPLVNLKQFDLVSERVQNYRADHQRFANDIRSADLEIVE